MSRRARPNRLATAPDAGADVGAVADADTAPGLPKKPSPKQGARNPQASPKRPSPWLLLPPLPGRTNSVRSGIRRLGWPDDRPGWPRSHPKRTTSPSRKSPSTCWPSDVGAAAEAAVDGVAIRAVVAARAALTPR